MARTRAEEEADNVINAMRLARASRGIRLARAGLLGTGGAAAATSASTEFGADFFTNNGASKTISGWENQAAAIYIPATDKTWISWEALRGTVRQAQVRVYNHTTETWGPVYIAGLNTRTDDDHGSPALAGPDPDGRIHMFYGAHNSNEQHSVSGVDDPSTWTALTAQGADYTYPHAFFVGGVLHLFNRLATTQCALQKSTAIAAGVVTWGAPATIIDFEAGSRFYNSVGFVDGTDIYILGNFANGTDTLRKDAYVFIYSTVDDSIRNVAGDVTVAVGAQPILLATANASFKVQAFTGAGGTANSPACIFKDSGGVLNIFWYTDDGAPVRLWHSRYVAAAWTVAEQIANGLPDRRSSLACAWSNADGTIECMYCSNADGGVYHLTRSAGGVWGIAALAVSQPANAISWNTMVPVQSGHADARAVFGQQNDDATVETGTLQAGAYGAGGVLRYIYPYGYDFTNFEAAQYVARMTSAPSSARKVLIDTLFTALKTADGSAQFLISGIWDVICLMAAHHSQTATLNILADRHNLTVGGGTPTFVTDRGFVYDGVADYHDTNFNPSLVPALGAQNSGSFWYWGYNEVLNTDGTIGWHDGTDGSTLFGRLDATTSSGGRMNQTNSTRAANGSSASSVGMFGMNRSGAGGLQFYKNGAAVTMTVNPAQASVALNNHTINIGRRDATIFAAPGTGISAWGYGPTRTAQQWADLYNALLPYMQGVGVA